MVASESRGGGGGVSLNNDSILDKLSDIERLLAERKRHGVIKDKVQHLFIYMHIRCQFLSMKELGEQLQDPNK